MPENKAVQTRSQNIILDNRNHLSVTGVTQVDNFDEQTIVMYTDLGELSVKGHSLHIDALNTQTGDVAISGKIIGMVYTDEREKSGFFSRIFR